MEDTEKDLRKLATVQKIIDIQPIDGADAIEVATVLGWKCVVKKGVFNVGDKVIYCEIDSLLPLREEFEFLRKSSYKKLVNGDEGFRIKTVKLRGQISQGLIIPVDDETFHLEEGTEVTEDLFVKKYEAAIPACLSGEARGRFPCFLHKTDEERLQSAKKVMKEFEGKEVYISTKMDGSSMTVYNRDGEFGVCSRNLDLRETEGNTFWKVAIFYDLKNKLPKNVCIQGELCGPGIQKNPLQLSGHEIFVFSVFDISSGEYLSLREAKETTERIGLKFVPIEYIGPFTFEFNQLLSMALGKYPGTSNHKEGIVIRPTAETYSHYLKGRLSIKIINNDYLVAGGE
jgi:RNA ligase (TIGR02306 family)